MTAPEIGLLILRIGIVAGAFLGVVLVLTFVRSLIVEAQRHGEWLRANDAVRPLDERGEWDGWDW